MPDLRPYQVRAVDAVRRHIQQGAKAPLLVSPTGSGKTVILAHVAASAVGKRRRVVIVAHRGELVSQISAALDAAGVAHGIIAPWARPNPFPAVQVASVATLAKRPMVPHCDLLIIDEAHHVTPGNTWGKVREALAPRHTLGLTATPVRTDGTGLGQVFDALEVVTTTAELVETGYLARPVVYAPATLPDLGGVQRVAGDYNRGQLGKVMGTAAITGDAVAHYRRLCPDVQAIAFGVSLEHCTAIADQFQTAGIPAAVVDGRMAATDRAGVLDAFRRGAVRVLVSCELIGEGFDVPACGAAILLRPTQSLGLYLQQVGRALRPAPGKTRAVILDHAGNTLRHGLPTDDREWSLEGDETAQRRGKKDPDAAPVWQCLACYAYTPSRERECEACGEARPFMGREVEVEAGELVEIQAPPRRPADPERGKARTLAQLEAIERARGYKAGWARHVFAARQRKMGG